MKMFSDAIIKNEMYLVGFDDVSEQAINQVALYDNKECQLAMALVYITAHTRLKDVITPLRRLKSDCLSKQIPLLLHIGFDVIEKPNTQQRLKTLQQLIAYADCVVVACTASNHAVQMMAQFPQWLSDLLHKPGLINLNFPDIKKGLYAGLAFFMYVADCDASSKSSPIHLISQQWLNADWPLASIYRLVLGIEGNLNMDLEDYVQLVEPFMETKQPFFLEHDMAVSAGMILNERLRDKHFNIGALFLGLDFVGSVQ